MERRQLEYFLALVEHRSFTEASYALHVAQPSVSQAIRALERELGMTLFDRLPRGIRLTAAGEALVGPARQVLRDFHGARDAVQSVRGLTVGRVDIAAAPFLAPHPLPLLVAAFRRRYPGVAVRVLDPRDGDVHAAVRSGEAEVGLSGEPAFGDDLRSHTLPERETFLALPPGAEGVSRERVVESGEEIRLVVWSKYRVWASQLLAARGIPAEIVAETEHQASIVPFVVAGVGGALLAGVRAVEVEAQGGVLCHLTPPVTTSAFLISPVEGLAPAAAAFWELVLREGQEAYAAS